MLTRWTTISPAVLLLAAVGCSDAAPVDALTESDAITAQCATKTFYTTKTPYEPQQAIDAYEEPPAGFAPVFTELVARHGSRGLSGMKEDAAAYAMWQKAQADGALTPLGESLGADIQAMMRANAVLGAGVPEVKHPGYGNLSKRGIEEHQQLAVRLLQRLPDHFAQVAASASGPSPRHVVVVSSGVDRAVDSAATFTASLVAHRTALAPLVTHPPAPAPYPAKAPVAQPDGTNRFLLYFHKLKPATDLVTDANDPFFATYQRSQAYQAYGKDPDVAAKIQSLLSSAAAEKASRAVLSRVFRSDFVEKIADGTYTFANTGTFTFTSDDGKFTTTVTGDGKTTIHGVVDAASMLYALYSIAPALDHEVKADFAKYFRPADAAEFAYLEDAQDFYQMGPGIRESNPVTYEMAQILVDDFFDEIDAIARGDLSHGAKLRFSHAEIIVPFASALGLKQVFAPLPKAMTYTYGDDPWRGEKVAPFAANVQWDVYRDAHGKILVKMLYDEKETDFKAACDGARHGEHSRYYDFEALEACYHHTPRP